ncbi:OLC1v1027610C1 [Oldenlandia corymbosa var. corymbosa]|uniref:OLC1v1027610C1 n=1 Tax=Oldenlandia corymbosa var. corymbosa TaxID=529605 RepID=A0AAV1CB22_OLDCO|nr:OLC1v1027610C1 [Oldenlandia corymbosa var. corymbosa]
MKFEDLLMQPSEEKQLVADLQGEVKKLQQELDGELQLQRALQCVWEQPFHSSRYITSLLPPKVQMLLTELTMVEEEIIWLERKVDELKLKLYQEKKQTSDWEMLWLQNLQLQPRQWRKKQLISQQKLRADRAQQKKHGITQDGRTSVGSSLDMQSSSPFESSETIFTEEIDQNSRCSSSRSWGSHRQLHMEFDDDKPNKLSEELIKSLIGIFLELNQATFQMKGSALFPKCNLSYMKPRGLRSKTPFSCRTSPFYWDSDKSNLDPYRILQDVDVTIRDIGPYKDFVQITRNSIDTSHLSECRPALRKLRVLMHKLRDVDLSYLTYKQKLAFWINTYNACIMHAFLQHGFPSNQDKLLTAMNEAAINVGGIVMNALAIEHFILRHPTENKQGLTHEKEMLLRHAYGLGYPEPKVTFALCRGCWSSPALRVYTPDDIVNELERAKVEYLEAAVGVTNKKKIMVPKLVEWHMRDFADDMQSLLEWIYSQLPQSGSLKRLIKECLNDDRKSSLAKMIEIQPYTFEFRYVISL